MSEIKNEILSEEEAYRTLCLFSVDEGARDAQSVRGWLKYSSYMPNETAAIEFDGILGWIYRDSQYRLNLVTY